tara:strand:+ start:171 stop:659 length:489 start_codon:yes stop_codon:yes gene_type:complete
MAGRKRIIKKPAVVYCRISGWSQAKNTSLQSQLEDGIAYANRNRMFVIAAFSDVGSASDCDSKLMGREQALRVCRLNKAVLLVRDYGRLTRTAAWQLNKHISLDIFGGVTIEDVTKVLLNSALHACPSEEPTEKLDAIEIEGPPECNDTSESTQELTAASPG